MDFLKDNKRTENKFAKANIISKYLFWYLNDIFRIGNKRPLEKTDIIKNHQAHNTDPLQKELEKKWKVEISKEIKKPSYFWTLFSFISKSYFLVLFLFTVMEAMKFMQPIFLKLLLDEFAKDHFHHDSYIWAAALTLTIFSQWMTSHWAFFHIETTGVRARNATLGMVFSKILRLRHCKLGAISSGHIVTLFSSDAHKLQEGLKLTPFIFIAPIEVLVVAYLLWRELGFSCFAGIGVILISLPFQSWLGKLYAILRMKTVKKSDERVSVMNEIISSMQVTKMYGWEESFSSLVEKIRKKETTQILKAALMRALNFSMVENGSLLNLLATFVTFYFHGDSNITLGKVYLVMSFFFIIRLTVVMFFPLGIQLGMEFYVSCKRIEKFLLEQEIPQSTDEPGDKVDKPYVLFDNVTANYEGESLFPVLENITFKADAENSLVIINGPIGSGKTSILMAALNEIPITKGGVDVKGTVSYAPQEAWIFSGTVRQNILFGRKYDEALYAKVIDACALNRDIKSFDKGDMTLVGEKGVSLSGGQKARIGLARATYGESDIYYLDDPLSAVDTKTGKHIFEKCIQTMLKDKIVILVTHQVQYSDQATQVINLKQLKSTYMSETDSDSGCSIGKRSSEESSLDIEFKDGSNTIDSYADTVSISSQNENDDKMKVKEKKNNDDGDDDEEETRSKGTVSASLYLKYFTKGVGIFQSTALVLLWVLGQGYLTFVDYWVGEWAQGEDMRYRNETTDSDFVFKKNPDNNIYLFCGLAVFGILLNTFRSMFSFGTLVRCSRSLHNQMFKAVLKAPMYFFDTKPVGQILNRFSRDVFLMDEELPWIFSDVFKLSLLCFTVLLINCINVPYMIIVAFILGVMFFYLRGYYLKVSREVRRLECVARSPLYSHISATLCGITSIRALNMNDVIYDEFVRCLDYQTEAWILFIGCSRWFSQRIDFMACTFIGFSIFAPVVLASYYDNLDRGLIAVSLTYLLNLCGVFQWCVRQSAEVDNMMTSVERVIEYTHIAPEADVQKNTTLPKVWPSEGNIKANAVFFSYHETLPNVLKNLSFDIKPKEKIGIVGRTGAGKSSLISMLFRLGNNSGVISIDGIDVSQIKLGVLRKAMSVIPQDPVLFGGSLRQNLDPFNEYIDEDIWNALEQVQLKTTVEDFKNKLQTEITESGSNLSVGERQLFCLARSLLKNTKVLMIDEATANVDLETDILIQKTIREKFRECTVLTIAHRLNTVMDSDRIMVMDAGEIAEFDEPHILLQNENGLLRKLVNQNSLANIQSLEQMAKQNYSLNQKQTTEL